MTTEITEEFRMKRLADAIWEEIVAADGEDVPAKLIVIALVRVVAQLCVSACSREEDHEVWLECFRKAVGDSLSMAKASVARKSLS